MCFTKVAEYKCLPFAPAFGSACSTSQVPEHCILQLSCFGWEGGSAVLAGAQAPCCLTPVCANSLWLGTDLPPLYLQAPPVGFLMLLTPAASESLCSFPEYLYLITTTQIPVIREFKPVTKAPFCHSGELPQAAARLPHGVGTKADGRLGSLETMADRRSLPWASQERSPGDRGRSGSRWLVWKALFKVNKLQLYCLNSNPFVSLCFLHFGFFGFSWGSYFHLLLGPSHLKIRLKASSHP